MNLHPPHPHVRHPRELAPSHDGAYDRFLIWVADHFLASRIVFTVFLVVPLLALPAPVAVKVTLGVITGGWMQSWALNAIQFTQVRSAEEDKAKQDTDHLAQTHIAHTTDKALDHLDLGTPGGLAEVMSQIQDLRSLLPRAAPSGQHQDIDPPAGT